MKFSWKGLTYFIIGSLLIVSHIFVGFYLVANLFDWKIDYANINPTEPLNKRNFTPLTFPPTNFSGIYIENAENTIILYLSLEYNGTLAEEVPALLHVYGTLSPTLAQEIDYVSFYFRGARPYPFNYSQYVGSGGMTLRPSNESDHFVIVGLGSYLKGSPSDICWQVQGDYFPSVDISFSNFTILSHNYENSDYLIHVQGKDVLEGETTNRIATSIGKASMFFAFVDGSVFVVHYFRGRKAGNGNEQQAPSQPKAKSKHDQPRKDKQRKHGKEVRKTQQGSTN